MNSVGVDGENIRRSRPTLLLLVILVIASGPVSRKFPYLLPDYFGTSIGDALWSLMIFLCWAFFIPSRSTARIATLALMSVYRVEFSQLNQAWINEVRHTAIGHLVFGLTSWCPDPIAYRLGVVGGGIPDKLFSSRAAVTSRWRLRSAIRAQD